MDKYEQEEIKTLLNDIKYYINENKKYGKTLIYILNRIKEYEEDN